MARKWQLQEAKNRFSEVVDLALEEGPQTVTRHGKEVVVVIAKEDLERKKRARAPRGSVVSFLRHLAFAGAQVDIERRKDQDREIEL